MNLHPIAKPDPVIKGKDFLTLGEFGPTEIDRLIDQALTMKTLQKKGIPHPYLNGKILGMIFEKASTRTRVSFQVGMKQLGGDAIFLSATDIQLGRGETIEDTAKVLSRYVDGLMVRTFSHEAIERFAASADVPVINGLTDLHHPTQVLADLLTIYEHKGTLKGLKIAYIGDGNNNMCHSLLEGAAASGMHLTVACPKGYEPNLKIYETAKRKGQESGGTIEQIQDPFEAAKDADVLVTDVWTSMGQEEEQAKRVEAFASYQVNAALCAAAADDFIFLHCLPAHRGEEVTAEIIDGPHSVVFDEAENRLHAQKALLKILLEG
ncbi:ornithine carbamoyltransferase [Camelliibacillus cellulosilyticus]|uniref:Ornithine carbamoyltransferase n=1 Tax=Camelliibacillus cellulosilyticus TaxID=2174486 RepID=A0ABV9GM07_9BACL